VFDGPTKPAVAEYLRRVFGTRINTINDTASSVVGTHRVGNEGAAEEDDHLHLAAAGRQELFASRPGYNRGEVRLGDGTATVLDFLVKGQRGDSPIVNSGDKFCLMMKYLFNRPAERVIFGIQIRTREGLVVYSANTFTVENKLYSYAAGDIVISEFNMRNSLLPGQYFITVGVSQFDESGVDIGAFDRRVDSIIMTVIGAMRHTNGLADMEMDSKITLETDVISGN